MYIRVRGRGVKIDVINVFLSRSPRLAPSHRARGPRQRVHIYDSCTYHVRPVIGSGTRDIVVWFSCQNPRFLRSFPPPAPLSIHNNTVDSQTSGSYIIIRYTPKSVWIYDYSARVTCDFQIHKKKPPPTSRRTVLNASVRVKYMVYIQLVLGIRTYLYAR